MLLGVAVGDGAWLLCTRDRGPRRGHGEGHGMFMISSVLSHAVETGDNLNIMGDGSKRIFCVVCIAGVC